MVKWYNMTLPMSSRGFDYPWPHKIIKDQASAWSFVIFARVIERPFELDYERSEII